MHHPALYAVAAEHPIIDLDGTVFVQLAIFLLTAAIASRFLFKPYLKMRDDRTEGIDGARKEADNLRAEADARMADYDEKLAAAKTRAMEEQRKIRADAAAHHEELTTKARTESAKALDEARAKVQSETESARAELLPRADALATNIVTKLIGREVA